MGSRSPDCFIVSLPNPGRPSNPDKQGLTSDSTSRAALSVHEKKGQRRTPPILKLLRRAQAGYRPSMLYPVRRNRLNKQVWGDISRTMQHAISCRDGRKNRSRWTDCASKQAKADAKSSGLLL